MRISEAWLRSYVNPQITSSELVDQLTMAGLEVDSIIPAASKFTGVVVGEVFAVEQHPDADRLRVCQVSIGKSEPIQIVCGASNVRVGMKAPTALIDAILPGDFKIKKSKLRGIESFGMMCSEKELDLAAEADGLMELPADAPVGADLREYLILDDNIIELDLTPNRADCLSVEGLAREIAALNKMDWAITEFKEKSVEYLEKLNVGVHSEAACPRYLGRLITNINPQIESPLWMKERLRRSGIRSLGAIVDITNYVLIELGQPLHAFDASKITGAISVRYAQMGESAVLLNGQNIELDDETLVIADDEKVLALAGVMGGSESAVSSETTNIFLECAFFSPKYMAGKARKYGLHTDSSHRFERGVDSTLQKRAIERATQLIVDIAGGKVGELVDLTSLSELPTRKKILLRKQRLEKMLDVQLTSEQVKDIFLRLGMDAQSNDDDWLVCPPGFRFDIEIEADLIEEIARIIGYNNLPSHKLIISSDLNKANESLIDIERIKDLLVDQGYQEAITYSFVNPELQRVLAPDDAVIPLKNPISSELSVMRSTLWSGLLMVALHNIHRQQNRVRLFETGLRFFFNKDQHINQQKMLSGLILGGVCPEQWGLSESKVDFFDVKADIESIFILAGTKVKFVAAQHPALHPGQTAEILSFDGQKIGWVGMLHPTLENQFGFDTQVFLFEMDQELILNKSIPKFKTLSKYPSVRRDLALIVDEDIPVNMIIDTINNCNETALQEVHVFDIYRGKGVDAGKKSVALGLIMQDCSQTLTELEIDAIFDRMLKELSIKIGARLRD